MSREKYELLRDAVSMITVVRNNTKSEWQAPLNYALDILQNIPYEILNIWR